MRSAVVADGGGARVVFDDLHQLGAFLGLQKALGGVELEPVRREALQRDAADVDRTLGHLRGKALLDQGVEKIGGGAAALYVVRQPVLPFLRKVGTCHPPWTIPQATGSGAAVGPQRQRARPPPAGKRRTPAHSPSRYRQRSR